MMPTVVLRRDILSETAAPPGISTARVKPDNSLAGILIFCGIGFVLTILAIVFQHLELPPPYF
jgi:hypothetical protein